MDPQTRRTLYIVGTYLIAAGIIAAAAEEAMAAASQNLGTETDVCRALTVTQVVAQNAGGDVVFCAHAPTNVLLSNSSWQLAAYVSSPQLTGSNPALTLNLVILGGCTAAAPIASGTAANAPGGAQQSRTWNLTMKGPVCRGYLQGKVVTSGNTLFDASIPFNLQAGDVAKPSSFDAWLPLLAITLAWILVTVLTRFIPSPELRAGASIVTATFLFLPMPEIQFIAILAGQSAVLVHDTVAILDKKR